MFIHSFIKMRILEIVDFAFSIGLSDSKLTEKALNYILEKYGADNSIFTNKEYLRYEFSNFIDNFLKRLKLSFRKDFSYKKERLYERRISWLNSELNIPESVLEVIPQKINESSSKRKGHPASDKPFEQLSSTGKRRKIQPILDLATEPSMIMYAAQFTLRRESKNDMRYLLKTPIIPRKMKSITNIGKIFFFSFDLFCSFI